MVCLTFSFSCFPAADICFQISEGYAGSPDLRITWLKNIGLLHKSNKDCLEAAQAYLVVAYLIAQYLDLVGQAPDADFGFRSKLLHICPYLRSPGFVGISRDDTSNKATALRLDAWTITGLAEVLYDAATLLADANMLEWSLDCYNMLIIIHKHRGQYVELLKAYAGAQLACKNLLKSSMSARPIKGGSGEGSAAAAKSKSGSGSGLSLAGGVAGGVAAGKVEPKYFRVMFIGTAFDKLNGRAFVYRGDPSHRLMDFSQFLIKRCQDNAAAYGATKVELLGNDKEATKELLEQKDVLYLQIARVYPVSTTTSSSSSSGGSPATSATSLLGGAAVDPAASCVVSCFQLDLAHSDQAKQQQQLAAQGRRKIYYTVQFPFPSFCRRIAIVDTKQVILTPLQNALQLMEERVAAVQNAVNSKNATVISGLLYGNLMTTISEGPEAVAEGFLGDKAERGEETERLRGLVKKFVELTAVALNTHESLMSADMEEWQATARKRFEALKLKLGAYTQ